MTGGRDSVCRVWDMRTKVCRLPEPLLCGNSPLHLDRDLAYFLSLIHECVAAPLNMSLCPAQVQVHCLTGHDDTVASILTQSTDPQVTSLSYPALWHALALISVAYDCDV